MINAGAEHRDGNALVRMVVGWVLGWGENRLFSLILFLATFVHDKKPPSGVNTGSSSGVVTGLVKLG